MNIQDYKLCVSAFGNAYIAKHIKNTELMCDNRKKLTHEEVIAFIHQYVKAWCEENETDNMQITVGGSTVMRITALELNEKGEENENN